MPARRRRAPHGQRLGAAGQQAAPLSQTTTRGRLRSLENPAFLSIRGDLERTARAARAPRVARRAGALAKRGCPGDPPAASRASYEGGEGALRESPASRDRTRGAKVDRAAARSSSPVSTRR